LRLNITKVRKQKGMSQDKLSEVSGVSRSYICELELGKYNNPTADVLCKISKALGCSIDDLVDCD
jgi:transcriptional regulator with XRE-family HTH domain